jgi:uncharacterized membrane protein (TIGR02234 family)
VTGVGSGPGGGGGSRRERLLAVGAVAVGAAVMLLAVSRTWVHAVVQDALAGRLSVDANGRQAAPVVAAVALVALAGAVAVLTLRTVGRFVAGLLLVLSGSAAAAAAIAVVREPSGALRSVVSGATGRSGDALPVAQQTAWPWVAAAGAVLVLLGGAVAVARARRWSGLSEKYDAPVGPAVVPSTRRPSVSGDADVDQPAADVLGHGLGPDGGDQAAARGADGSDAGSPAQTPVAADPWDRLSRGEDPTA